MNSPTDPLAQLRDLHLPESVGWWPPAPGWWGLAGIFLAVVALGVYWMWRRFQRNRYRREAMARLQEVYAACRGNGDGRLFLEECSALLRRVAMEAYGRVEVAALTGEGWLDFLDRTGATEAFRQGPGRVLATALFQPAAEVDMDSLHHVVRGWIKEHKRC